MLFRFICFFFFGIFLAVVYDDNRVRVNEYNCNKARAVQQTDTTAGRTLIAVLSSRKKKKYLYFDIEYIRARIIHT